MATVTRSKSKLTRLEGVSWTVFEAIVSSLTESRPSMSYSDGELQIEDVISGVTWTEYERLLEALPEDRLPHVYFRGELRLMSPLREHDRTKKLVARFVEMASFTFGIEMESIGSTTLRARKIAGGLEPDEAYYIKHEPLVRGTGELELSSDPPPDLVLEIDVTHKTAYKLPVYAALGVPEIWRLNRGKIEFLKLVRRKRAYQPIARSLSFPMITPQLVNEHLAMKKQAISENEIVRAFVSRLTPK